MLMLNFNNVILLKDIFVFPLIIKIIFKNTSRYRIKISFKNI